jgi:hypothetical protein
LSSHATWRPAVDCPDPDAFNKSITNFSERYAGQKEQDYQQFFDAVRSGRLEAVEGA